MTFLRPEALAALRRWREVLIYGLGFLVFGGLFLRSLANFSLFWLVVLGAAAFFCGTLTLQAWVRAQVGSDGSAQGVVLIDEHRIGYFGPQKGGFVEMQHLTRLDVYNGSWILLHRNGEPLKIPFDAPNADALIDLFAQLPEVTTTTLTQAMRTRQGLLQTVWER